MAQQNSIECYQVIPLPKQITGISASPFKLDASTCIVYPRGNAAMKRNAEFLSDYILQNTGIKLPVATKSQQNSTIVLAVRKDASKSAESYSLTVAENRISIIGASEAAVFYGIQTLRKSISVKDGAITLPSVEINDSPRFEYRGMMLDVARHTYSVSFIKKYIDILALHNINIFHWHLTDDQGWRIEIKKYPKLTQIGSHRNETVIGRNSGTYDGKPYDGYFTQEEVKEIVAYAKERYITIIPEIDLPGHMQAALASYPQLGCTGGPYEVAKEWGVFEDVLCIGKPETMQFITDVLDEVIKLFPAKYIHIGGDECPKVRWEQCPRCQAKIKELGIIGNERHKTEHYLQSYVTEYAEIFLNKHGRKLIGWDEILEGKLAPNATVMSWQGVTGGIEAAKLNHDVIMSPTTHAYFDYYQSKDTDKEPFGIGGYLPLKLVYSFEPIDSNALNKEQQKHIIGVQANLWSEYITSSEHAEYMILPRLAALCEVQWTVPENKNFSKFLNRLALLTQQYERLGYNYRYPVKDE